MKETVRQLVEAFGPSGYEEGVREIIRAQVENVADDIRTDALGNLIVHRAGDGDGSRIMLAAHCDEIGAMVSYIDEKGFCRIAPIGGVSPLYEMGGRVRFANGQVGVIGSDKIEGTNQVPRMDKLYVDVGATSRDDCPVAVGDVACFLQPMVEIGGNLTSKAMDNRAGCAVLVETLRRLGETPHDLYVVFSTQEEVGLRGATTAAYGVSPDVGIAVDVTPAGDIPEPKSKIAVELGKGPAVKIKDSGMLATRWVKDWMLDSAANHDIPAQREVLLGGTTDARAIQTSKDGVAAGCLSVPCRYVHSPSETVSLADVENSVRLLVAMLSGPVPA